MSPPRYAFISPCGLGNLGDAAIVDSVIHAIRRRVPDAVVLGYTLNPGDTRRRHEVDDAGPLTSFSMPFYPMVDHPTADGTDDGGRVASPDDEHPPDGAGVAGPAVEPPGTVRQLADRLRTTLRRRRASSSVLDAVLAARRLAGEPRALRHLRQELAGLDAVVVAGGGQLDAQFGGLFGQPYVLWRWRRTAHAVGARYLVLSVGTGTLGGLSRRLAVRALRGADYRSYRDPTSRAKLGAPEVTDGDPIVPDLAYAIPRSAPPSTAAAEVVVGVSPMNYRHPEFHPRGDAADYEQHLDALTSIARSVVEQGHRVVVFVTDLSDEVARRDLVERLRALGPAVRDAVSVCEAETVDELWTMYGSVDVVVATRLHSALLAHVAHRPVLALAHERKVRELMADMGHSRYCFEPLDLDDRTVRDRMTELVADRHAIGDEIARSVAARRAAVERQYDEVFGGPPAS